MELNRRDFLRLSGAISASTMLGLEVKPETANAVEVDKINQVLVGKPTGKGYMGKVLFVDLAHAKIQEQTIAPDVYEHFLAGHGLAAFLLYHWIPARADPLGPDNILGFMAGLLTGTGALFSGRWSVVGKSPLTGAWGDASCGGKFAPAIKRCGYDGIFFHGFSPQPVYLLIHKKRMELCDATDLWGKNTVETEEILKERHGENSRVACIGPAGEKLSLISGICTDRGRIAARAGLGAVMGSKRLKAVVLSGNRRIGVYNHAGMKRLSQMCNEWVQFDIPMVPGPWTANAGAMMRGLSSQVALDGWAYKIMLKTWGTCCMNQMSVEMGDAPIKNWKGSNVDFPPKRSLPVNPDAIISSEERKYHCYACPLGCGGICSPKGAAFSGTHKPEYESTVALGGLLLNEDAESIFYMNEILNRAGMDAISAGATVAFAMECFEQGILTREDTDGIELTWGNTEAIKKLVEKMIAREGIGDILADGSRVASRRIGKDSSRFAIHAGGQEPAMHDGRADPGFSLHYSVEPAPGKHTTGCNLFYDMMQLWKEVKGLPKVSRLYPKDSMFVPSEMNAVKASACARFMNIVNGSGLCVFGVFMGIKRTPTFGWLNAATGWNRTPEEYMLIGERIQTLKQAFNIKHGIEPKNMRLNDRALGSPALSEGANKGRTVDIEGMSREYWKQFGWDPESGKPTTECMQRLQLEA